MKESEDPAFKEIVAMKKKTRQNYLWLQVTEDELSLPLIVADTRDELAEKAGLASGQSISRYFIHRRKFGEKTYPRYVKVEFIDE